MSKQNSCQGFHHKKENYIQLLDLTWPKQNSCNKNPQPPITFLMVRPLLIFKPQTNIRKNQLKHFTITFIVSVFRILIHDV